MIKRPVFLAAAAMTVALLLPGTAAAATEFGSTCPAESSEGNLSLLQIKQAASNGLPLTAPAAGVITRWAIEDRTGADPGEFPQALQVYRQSGAGTDFTLIAQTEAAKLAAGPNNFAVRIPVQAGDRLGITSPVETMYCPTIDSPEEDNDLIGYFQGSIQVGETKTFEEDVPFRIPVRASIEPDADNDGYGDESQDQCPQSAATQSACPLAALTTARKTRKGSVVVSVTVDTPASVTVNGLVKLGKGKRAKLSGGTQAMTPGAPANFTLKFPKKVKAKLAELSRKKALTLKVDITATNVAGQVTMKTLKVRLKGRSRILP